MKNGGTSIYKRAAFLCATANQYMGIGAAQKLFMDSGCVVQEVQACTSIS
jgi:hypothetical protein